MLINTCDIIYCTFRLLHFITFTTFYIISDIYGLVNRQTNRLIIRRTDARSYGDARTQLKYKETISKRRLDEKKKSTIETHKVAIAVSRS